MAPRATGKRFAPFARYLPFALYPATTDSEKNQLQPINRNTGHRITSMKVDADTGEEVPTKTLPRDTMSDPDPTLRCRRMSLKTSHWNPPARAIDEFSCRDDIDPRYLSAVLPGPDGKLVTALSLSIRETIRNRDKVPSSVWS